MKPALYRGQPTFRTTATMKTGVCGLQLIRSIDGAKSTIKIATTHFRREDIQKALLHAHDRGVKVQLLLDQQEFHSEKTKISNARFDEALSKAGVNVRYKVYSRYWDYRTALQMHCKYMIVDDSVVHTGSLNWSENSELKTLENLLTLRVPDLVDEYVKRFELQWSYGSGTLPALLENPCLGTIPFSDLSTAFD